VLTHYAPQIAASSVLQRLQLREKQYVLVTAHRAENVDNPGHLRQIMRGLQLVADELQQRIVCSIHPRTKSRLERLDFDLRHPLVELHEPFGFFDFVKLEQHALCTLTDSGTVQEECCIFQVPTVTMRSSTERPETVDCGSNVVSGLEPEQIASAAKVMMNRPSGWRCPEGYLDTDVSAKVVTFLLGGKKHVC
jgi:UDP-N-acetylglucosamine 2-epimerase (non-hydrolysing)